MQVKVKLTFREDDLASLGLSPEEFAKEIRLAAAVKWHELGLISQAKPSEIAGIGRGEFIDALICHVRSEATKQSHPSFSYITTGST